MNTFNPIKEEEKGKKAKAMVWSSKSINMAITGLDMGKKLIANPFYEGQTKLMKGDMPFQRTEEENTEFLRCMNDVVYFASKYCKLMTPEGIKNVTLRDYQEDYLKHLEDNRLSIFLSCRQSGKCNSLITNVLIKFNDNFNFPCQELKKYWRKHYYISKEDSYEAPLFEIYNLVAERTWIWRLKYYLYKLIYKIENDKIKKGKKTE